MEVDKKNYLVSGAVDAKTREKIRLKLRLIFNNYKRCIIGTAHLKEIPGLGYSYEQEGYKHLFFVYKSASLEKVRFFKKTFEEMYVNELEEYIFDDDSDDADAGIKKEKGQYVLYITGKTKRKLY